MSKMSTIEEEASSSSNMPEVNQKEAPNVTKDEGVSANKVPFYKLFSFADSIDIALMIIGSIGAVGNGLAMPMMSVLLGELVDAFGQNQNDKRIIHIISKFKWNLHKKASQVLYLHFELKKRAIIEEIHEKQEEVCLSIRDYRPF